jgi:hypothetical protein
MTDNNPRPYNGKFDAQIFDEYFIPLSFYNTGDRLLGIDVGVIKLGGRFVLSIATPELYSQRSQQEPDETIDEVFVVASDELLPSDLLGIKELALNTDRLQDFLQVQSVED